VTGGGSRGGSISSSSCGDGNVLVIVSFPFSCYCWYYGLFHYNNPPIKVDHFVPSPPSLHTGFILFYYFFYFLE